MAEVPSYTPIYYPSINQEVIDQPMTNPVYAYMTLSTPQVESFIPTFETQATSDPLSKTITRYVEPDQLWIG